MSVTKLYTFEDLSTLESEVLAELIEGELREVPPSDGYSSGTGARASMALLQFVDEAGLGYVTGAEGAYVLARSPDTVLVPDVGFIRAELLPGGLPRRGFIPHPPDLAVEVMSSTDRYTDAVRKAGRYLAAGTRLVWVVRPDENTVVIFAPDREPQELSIDDTLDGEGVLPGFRLPLTEIFR